MSAIFASFFSILVAFHIWGHFAACVTPMEKLRTELFAKYTKWTPNSDEDKPVEIGVAFQLYQMTNIDAQNELMNSVGQFHFSWRDENLVWDENKFAVSSMALPAESVWMPDIIVYNSAIDNKDYDWKSYKVLVTSQGTVTWSPRGPLTTTCELDFRHFPYDIQTCAIEITIMTSDANFTIDNTKDNANPLENGQWQLISSTNETGLRDGFRPLARFAFTLERRPDYYMKTHVLPAILLSLLSSLAFVIPQESGEKITFMITLLLSSTVYLIIIAEQIPKSTSIPYFATFLYTMMSCITFVMMFMIVRMRLRFRKKKFREIIPRSDTNYAVDQKTTWKTTWKTTIEIVGMTNENKSTLYETKGIEGECCLQQQINIFQFVWGLCYFLFVCIQTIYFVIRIHYRL